MSTSSETKPAASTVVHAPESKPILLRLFIKNASWLVPLLIAGAGLGLNQVVESTVDRVLQADKENLDGFKQQLKTEIAEAIRKQGEMHAVREALEKQASEFRTTCADAKLRVDAGLRQLQTLEAGLKELQELKTSSEQSHAQSLALLKQAEELKQTLGAAKKIADLSGDVSKIIGALKQDPDFQDSLTHELETKMSAIQAQVKEVQARVSGEMTNRLLDLSKQVAQQQISSGTQGVPYCALRNGVDNYATIHAAMTADWETGKVHFDETGKVQFYRLSSSVAHNGRTPRCHAMFQGWLPESSFSAGGPPPGGGVKLQRTLLANIPEEQRSLRDDAASDARVMAIFNSGTVFFATGEQRDGWIEVTFDGWVPLSFDKSNKLLVAPVNM